MDDKNQYVFDLEYDEIYVNPQTLINEKNITESKLNFQLLNPSRFKKIQFVNPNKYTANDILVRLQKDEPVDNTSYLSFNFHVGDKEQDLISINDAVKMTVQTENVKWTSSAGSLVMGTYTFIVSCEDKSELAQLLSLYIKFENIYSFAPQGQTSFYVEINNVVGIDNIVKVFSIQKKPSKPKVLQFTSDYTTFKYGDHATLKWLLTNEKYAQLQPGNINIKEEAPANTYPVNVTRNIEYQLTVFNGYEHDTAHLNLYIAPPQIISFTYDKQSSTVSWDTNYAQEITLFTDEVETLLTAKGNKQIKLLQAKQIVLKVTGYEYTEYVYIQTELLEQLDGGNFTLKARQFKTYSWSNWTWLINKATNADALNLLVTENVNALNTQYSINISNAGVYEYISSNPIPASTLQCNLAGQIYSFTISAVKE